MKLKRFEIAAIAATLIFASFTTGYFTGRNSIDSVVTVVQSAPESRAAVSRTPGNSTGTGETASPGSGTGTGETAASVSDTGAEKTEKKLDLNTADAAELELLPGIGEVLARRILDYREERGGFLAVEELLNVSGIGDKKFESIKDLVIVG